MGNEMSTHDLGNYGKGIHFSLETFLTLFLRGWIVDARAGGLVVGRSHDAGNIYFIKRAEDSKYYICGSVEGGEYIINNLATRNRRERLLELNKYNEPHEIEHSRINSGCTRVLNTHAEPFDKFLWLEEGDTMIVNKYAVSKYFQEIENINDESNNYKVCEFNTLEFK